jgi:polyisoprenoid-binding protein YceI
MRGDDRPGHSPRNGFRRSASTLELLRAACVSVLLLGFAGCPVRPQTAAPAPSTAVPPSPSAGKAEPGPGPTPHHEGRPFDVESRQSLLTILAFRGGALAKAGHNHVIASHDVSGAFYVPDDVNRTTFELHIPVQGLTIDEPELRAKEGADFPADVPQSARDGTRRNMLSEALLNGAQYPDITLVSQHIDSLEPGARVRADVEISIRGQTRTISVPVSYSLANGELTASGDLPLKQSDLGLTPFSAMLGALQVQDELRVRFRIVAREATTKRPSAHDP